MTTVAANDPERPQGVVRIFLCGDVMPGRGIDQILPNPCPPGLHEDHMTSAIQYVELAEAANGPIPRRADPDFVWGDVPDALKLSSPDLRIINLETSITRSESYVPKGINYRMSSENAECLRILGAECCVIANNHVLDWGEAGLSETLSTLEHLHAKPVGAGHNLAEASAPAIFELPSNRRVIVFAFACLDSGTHMDWAATDRRAGVNLLGTFSRGAIDDIAKRIAKVRRPGDVIVISIHWGSNWGYEIPLAHREFAQALIDVAGVSIVHGHSSHHAKAIEVFKNRLILYGCGDFLNDYEGIRGYEEFRDDLSLMYLADIDHASGHLVSLQMLPLQIRQFHLIPAASADVDWLQQTLDGESRKFGVRVERESAGRLRLSWPATTSELA